MNYYQRIVIAILLLVGFVLYSLPTAVHSQSGNAVLFVNPSLTQVGVAEEFEIRISVRDVVDLYGYELNVTFLPDKMEVVSIEKGDFLEEWVNPINQFDNVSGQIEFDLSQGEPSLPKIGEGELLLITFKAKEGLISGNALIQIQEDSLLTDENGIAIPSSTEPGMIIFTSPYLIFLPLIQK